MITETFYGPNDAASFQLLLFLESGVEPIAAGVTVQAQAAGVIVDGIPVWVDQNRGNGEGVEELSDDGFVVEVKMNLTPCLRRALTGRRRMGMFAINLRQ